ncbi:MAG TPA: beta-L-arabinofuranosidase domain-containing protein [Fimbriimonas sp.]
MVILLTIASALAANGAFGPASPVMAPDRKAEYRLEGLLERRVQGVVHNWLLEVPEKNPAILQMFRDRDKQPYQNLLPWSGEFAGKYLTSGVEMLRLTGDPKLKARLGAFVRQLVECQDEEGYLGPFPKGHRLTGTAPNVWGTGGDTWDAWGHYHAMLGLLLWNEATGSPEALAAASRIGDLLCRTYLESGTTVAQTRSPEMNQAIVHSMALLYRQTGDAEHLRLAESVVRDFSHPAAGNYLEAALAGEAFHQLPANGPRWESLHSIMGLAELHWITGNPDYRKAFERLWWSIAETDRHNNGGFTSGEQAQGNPYHSAPIETCCTIAWIAMGVEMLKMTGDPKVADELELSTLNQVAGLHSPDGSWCTYNTPMAGTRVPSTEDIAFQIRPGSEQLNCCSVNAARGFGLISDWALMRRDGGLVLNWFGSGSLSTEIEGTKVVLRQETSYPQDGRIEIGIEPLRPRRFPLRIRIPHWSENTKASLNGEPLDAVSGTYLEIDREWKPGDRVALDLDLSPRFWVGQRDERGRSSVYRGPILFALETPGVGPRYSKGWEQGLKMRVARQEGASVQYRFEGDWVRWHGNRYDDAGIARVRIDGKEVDRFDLYSPDRDLPFVWERKGLGAGPHTLEIEASGSKRDASKAAWINVVRLEPAPAWKPPKLHGLTLREARFQPIDDGVGYLEVVDAEGNPVRLRDYGSAGADRTPYVTWLSVEGLIAEPFSRGNPSRTGRRLR